MIKLKNNLFSPDVYFAENMADYKNNAPKIKLSFAQRLNFSPTVCINVNDVYLERYMDKEDFFPYQLFSVYDGTGFDLMVWNKESLEKKVYVSEIFFKYSLKHEYPVIIEVNKYKKKYSCEKLSVKIRNLTPSFNFSY